ncbi:hypothetical protein [Desulfonema magnum]|uniref:Uncharacterized protein n=1 Tax=Desulfonema magnum TaxID=45655 RepID=A0A975BGD9_9BACT|nr:hypothetical protein [Desulfonema magnum]QTA84818.1 Uncharacterized protein dnm_008190 [Desulfonema magnum]
MSDDNKHNILYFEGSSVRKLYENMETWQHENRKRFLSTSIQKDGDKFCCIALTNPSEVVVVCGKFEHQAFVTDGCLSVKKY